MAGFKATPLLDKNGQPCFSRWDAEKLADMIARDSTQPFLFASSCGYRTELMVGRLLEAGAPPEAVARVYQTVPEDEKGKTQMSAKDNGVAHGSFQRLLELPADTAAGKYPVPGGNGITVTFTGGKGIFLQDKDGRKGWNKQKEGLGIGFRMSADNAPWHGDNHITGGIYVLDPATNVARLMVIDPHLDMKDPLMTPRDWKERVHCESSVVMAGKIGKLSEILPECLTRQQEEKMDKAIAAEGGSRFIGYDRVVARMLGVDPDRKREGGTPIDVQKYRDFRHTSSAQFPDAGITTDWNGMKEDERRTLLKRWEEELKPLRDLQNVWQRAFAPRPKAAQKNAPRLG
jgi:hypothetical protein